MSEVAAVQTLVKHLRLDVPLTELPALAEACARQRASIEVLYAAGIDPDTVPYLRVDLRMFG